MSGQVQFSPDGQMLVVTTDDTQQPIMLNIITRSAAGYGWRRNVPLPVMTLDRTQGVLAGLTLAPLTDDARRRLRLGMGIRGVLVSAVAAGSAAQTAGLVKDDVI